MTARIELSSRLGACVPGSASTAYPCGTAHEDPAGLNGIAWRQTNSTKDAYGPAAPARTPWAAIVIAIVAVALVIGVELWAARRPPPPDGTVASTVASEVSATLGDVAASSILIDP